MQPRSLSVCLLALILSVSCARGSMPEASPATPGPAIAGAAREPKQRAADFTKQAEGEDEFFGLLSFPAKKPAAAPEPEAEPEIEPAPTSGTCVGEPSKAAKKQLPVAMCCYTSPSVFIKHVRSKWDTFKACYGEALERNPKVRGRITAKFTIEDDGSVIGACDAGSTVGDPKLVECVLRGFMTVKFDATPEGDPCPAATLMYPIQFTPSEPGGSQ